MLPELADGHIIEYLLAVELCRVDAVCFVEHLMAVKLDRFDAISFVDEHLVATYRIR